MTFALLSADHALRPAAEAFVRAVYARHYGAVVRAFPPTLAALVDAAGEPACVAGVRFGLVDCFSEQYLDLPIELALRDAAGVPVDRMQILEVTTLASAKRASPLRLVAAVTREGRARGMRWGVFTATRPLRAALLHAGVALIELAPASRERIASARDWGRYYETDPWVCAVADRAPARPATAEAPDPVRAFAHS